MGKAARNRRIRREATEIALSYGTRGNPKPLARLYRRLALQHKRQKQPSKPIGPRVWREQHERVPVDTTGADDLGNRRFRDRLRHRQGN